MSTFNLQVGGPKIRQYSKKPAVSAVTELIWNALDANATEVSVELERAETGAIDRVEVTDNGDGFDLDAAKMAFGEYGDTWKAKRTKTVGDKRILHGKKGEGRLFAFSLGDNITWQSRAISEGKVRDTRVTSHLSSPQKWDIEDLGELDHSVGTGTVVSIDVPQTKTLSALEQDDTDLEITARLAFYLRSYADVKVIFNGNILDPKEAIAKEFDLELNLPSTFDTDERKPFVTVVEWTKKVSAQRLLICDQSGVAFQEFGEPLPDSLINFTPYLRSDRFKINTDHDLALAIMKNDELIQLAMESVKEHLSKRRSEMQGEIVGKLKKEGIYPYPDENPSASLDAERKTFDVVITAARGALPKSGPSRRLAVKLFHHALESDPGHLQDILNKVLDLPAEDQQHLANLLQETELSNVIRSASTVTNRMKFIAGLRKILSDKESRREFREVDQLHPMIADNLWLFGDEWELSRSEVGLTSVLESHLANLDEGAVLETKLDTVKRADGSKGRVDIVLFRGIGDDKFKRRLVIELKRPSVRVGKKELDQVKSYARAIVDDPQFNGTSCKWTFILVTYDFNKYEIDRDINQKDKPHGLADDQEEYEVWVKSWGEIFEQAESNLKFFYDQLEYEATDSRVLGYLEESYKERVPERVFALPKGETLDDVG